MSALPIIAFNLLNNIYNINYNTIFTCHQRSIPVKSDLVKSLFISVNIKVFGGEPGPAATLAPKLGPLGLVIFI